MNDESYGGVLLRDLKHIELIKAIGPNPSPIQLNYLAELAYIKGQRDFRERVAKLSLK